MPDEQKPKQPKVPKERKKVTEPETESVLTTAAKAIGTAAGKVAVMAGAVEPAAAKPHTESVKQPKLQKKHKHRLPRWEKKAAQKAAAAQTQV